LSPEAQWSISSHSIQARKCVPLALHRFVRSCGKLIVRVSFTGGYPFAGLFARVLPATAVLLIIRHIGYQLYQRKIFFRL
jgi:hypothetical protein